MHSVYMRIYLNMKYNQKSARTRPVNHEYQIHLLWCVDSCRIPLIANEQARTATQSVKVLGSIKFTQVILSLVESMVHHIQLSIRNQHQRSREGTKLNTQEQCIHHYIENAKRIDHNIDLNKISHWKFQE